MSEDCGAIRMLAFGVLEYTKPGPSSLFDTDSRLENAIEVERLIVQEIDTLGWKLAPSLQNWGARKPGKWVLLGPIGGSTALPVRPTIGEGTLEQCCRAAVDYLDNGARESYEVHFGKNSKTNSGPA